MQEDLPSWLNDTFIHTLQWFRSIGGDAISELLMISSALVLGSMAVTGSFKSSQKLLRGFSILVAVIALVRVSHIVLGALYALSIWFDSIFAASSGREGDKHYIEPRLPITSSTESKSITPVQVRGTPGAKII